MANPARPTVFDSTGATPITSAVQGLYTAEYAYQKDFARNPSAFELDYYHLIAGASVYGITGKVGFEHFSGQDGVGFSTPLGTNHAFQGWADAFLITPAVGIRDTYGSLSTTVMGIKLLGVFHSFHDDSGNTKYGSEYNFLLSKKFGKHYGLLAKYAYFDTNRSRLFSRPSRQKIWFQVSITF